MTWAEKCRFIKDIIDSSNFNWKQNDVFHHGNVVSPVPSIEQWDELFTTLGVEAVPQKNLFGTTEESFNRYFEHICAQKQKGVLNEALCADQTRLGGVKKKM